MPRFFLQKVSEIFGSFKNYSYLCPQKPADSPKVQPKNNEDMSEKDNELYTKKYIDKQNYLVSHDRSGINIDHSKSYDFVDMAYDFLDSLGISNVMADNYTNESLWNDYVDYVEKNCSKYEIDECGRRVSEQTYIVNYCPFCGSENIEWMGESYGTDDFHCHECDKWFGIK